MHLTVGVFCQNGMPYLQQALAALPAVERVVDEVDFILVDSASTDGTLAAMQAFAAGKTNARVFAMTGVVNASATRNVVLSHAGPGAVFLVDGDVAVEPAFVAAALDELEQGTCDIVFGRLPEQLHDGQHRPTGVTQDRYKVGGRHYVRSFGGVVLLGPAVVAAGVRYDETMRRGEDRALAAELAERFRILSLPITMGTHYTVSYFHEDRIRTYYRTAYMRPHGRIFRDNLRHPRRIWHSRRIVSGYVAGLIEVLLLIAAIISGSLVALIIVVALIACDVARFASQGRLNEWIPIRLIGMAQIVWGTIVPERQRLSYQVREVPAGEGRAVVHPPAPGHAAAGSPS